MPRDYAIVLPTFWTGATGRAIRALGRDPMLLAAYLMTSPHANMIGLYHLPLAYLSHDTGIPLEGASEGLRSLGEVGFAFYDEATEVVWVPEMARFQILQGKAALKAKDKQVAGIHKLLAGFRKSVFYARFVEHYRDAFHLGALPPSEAPSKGLRSQDQEQDQEQRNKSALSRVRARDGLERGAAGADAPEVARSEAQSGLPTKEDPARANAGGGGQRPASLPATVPADAASAPQSRATATPAVSGPGPAANAPAGQPERPAATPEAPPRPVQREQPGPGGIYASTGTISPIPRKGQVRVGDRWVSRPEAFKATAEVLAVVNARGWQLAWGTDEDGVASKLVDDLIRAATAPVAVKRLLGMLEADRGAGRVTQPWITFHTDVLRGEQKTKAPDVRVGRLAPAPAEAFQEGEYDLSRI